MLEKAVKKGLHYADDIEVYYSKSTIHSVAGKRGRLKAESIIDQGAGFRVQVDGKVGFAFTTDVNDYETCIEHAVSIARCKKESVGLKFPCSSIPAVEGLYSKETAQLSVEDSIAYLDELLLIDDRDIDLAEGSLEIREMERTILNSSGLEVCEKGTFADLSVAVQGSCLVSGDRSSRSFQNLNGDAMLENLVERARNSPEGKIGKGINTIIFSPEAGSLLFSTLLCPAFCADNVLQSQSFLGEFEGKMVASRGLTVKDDATINGGLVSRSFDAEGIPSRCFSIIENGQLAGFLHNMMTAKLTGKESTGNAFRDYRNEPIVFPSNIVLEHENVISRAELIEETRKGVMCQGIIGAYSSDYITGDFSVTLDECSLVENGMMKRIENINIGGNAVNLLKSIECVSEERIQSGHLIIPCMKISDSKITIS